MKITMTKTKKGADDGVTVRTYEAGQSYDVGEDLGRAFIDAGWAGADGGAKGRNSKDPDGKADGGAKGGK